ncbi:MAG: hypothetical protein VX278_03145 [Myxococcota bacterium]|nr:hypothetical protein [Myxococcota bacterium]
MRSMKIGISAVALLSLLGSRSAQAGSAMGDEILSVTEGVSPNVLFLIDLSSNMSDPCNSSQTESCLATVIKVIDAMSQHYDWARYGVIGTADSATTNTFKKIVPLGTSHSKMASALTSVSTNSSSVVHLAESLSSAMNDYFTNGIADDQYDDDGDGFTQDWNESPIQYSCQKNHVIVFTNSRPAKDNTVAMFYKPDLASVFNYTDIYCSSSALTSSTNYYTTPTSSSVDEQCFYDQTVYQMYSWDSRPDFTGDQIVTVHTIGIGTSSDTIADAVYQNASDLIGGAGTYVSSGGTFDAMLSSTLGIMSGIRSGLYSRSAPVLSSDGDYMIFSFYEINSSDPLAEGHIRAYEVDNDPTSSTYGNVLYNGSSSFGGALWDGGTLLVSRLVTASESNEEDRDGIGRRDIYTFFEDGASLLSSESNNDRRQGFDLDFVTAIGGNSTALDLILNTSATCSAYSIYDLDEDCDADSDDLQALVDFARGLPEAEFPEINTQRGTWKLGDAPYATPVVVMSDDNLYTLDPTYRKFLDELEQNKYPPIVLSPANDGMLHAFRLNEDDDTSDTEIGEELWAWIPGYLLYRTHDAEWAGSLIDQMLYGRTYLFDGTPVVEDVWIDENGDGTKDCNSVPNDCEWKRVVVVQQGKGGPLTLALDITDTTAPKFLWEHVDESDSTAIGYTVGRPVIANIYDASDSSNPIDRYVAFWGSGRAVPYSTNQTYYKSTEANLYMWAMGDDYFGTTSAGYQDSAGLGSPQGYNGHPESSVYGSSLNIDSDSAYEYAYISAALAVVDVDSDGDADTLYFPVTTAYKPISEGGSLSTITDPGSTWMYKACVSTSSPGKFKWAEFYDPVDDGSLLFRPEIYYAATTSWHSDGQLGVYWGSGSPYDRNTNRRGYFFAVKDSAPGVCSGFTVTPITDCGANGIYKLKPSEGLTADPVAYAGVVYFPTWTPASDRCNGGTGKLYGLSFDDCSSGLDTDGDGDADSSDDVSVSVSNSYISSVAVTDAGTIVYGTSAVASSTSTDSMNVITSATNPFLGTHTIAWMEVF